jgi:3-phenylpropionate/trans-cinnamate dioxygenase ferredoxin reductase component
LSTIVVIGGGHAGAQAIDTLRREGFSGRLILVSDEPELPYQRPPLSKRFLSGELAADRLSFRHRAFYDEHRIDLRLGTRVLELDSESQSISLSTGDTLVYDQLLLCLGAAARRLPCQGADLVGVHYLRTLGDAASIRKRLNQEARVVIIGGGYIGLEIAATARTLGCSVTILEMAERVMNRVVAPEVSQYFELAHRRKEVNIVCNTRVMRLEGRERAESVICDDGWAYQADLVVVGIGAIADSQLAMDAGLKCDNGIVVDQYCRTSDANIYAAGDCANHPSTRFRMRVRLESVDNAFEQAKVAALNMLGRPTSHDSVPWFWSDQFHHKLLIAGLPYGHDERHTRGDPNSESFSVCYLKGGELLCVEAVNHTKDYMAARKLIADYARPDTRKLGDPRVPLKESV